MQKYIVDMRMIALKEIENSLKPKPVQSNFKIPSETSYIKYLMCPRVVLLSDNNSELSKYIF